MYALNLNNVNSDAGEHLPTKSMSSLTCESKGLYYSKL